MIFKEGDKVLAKFSRQYLKYYYQGQKQLWANYFDGGTYNINRLDNSIFYLLTDYQGQFSDDDKDLKKANQIIARGLVDKDPQVAVLKNRLEQVENYQGSDDFFQLDPLNQKIVLAMNKKQDVQKLQGLREQLAKRQGYSSYQQLIQKTDQLPADYHQKVIIPYWQNSKSRAQKLITKYGLTYTNWFKALEELKVFSKVKNAEKYLAKFSHCWGFNKLKTQLKIKIQQQGWAGYTAHLSPNQVKIAIKPLTNFYAFKTFCHEVGHALFYLYNQQSNLNQILPPSLSETLAVVFEYLALKSLADEMALDFSWDIFELDYIRCALLACFEADLTLNPTQGDVLYQRQWQELNLIVANPVLWNNNSFFSLDPYYIHNYVLGVELAQLIYQYLHATYDCDYNNWGNWLIQEVYQKGSTQTYLELRTKVEQHLKKG